VVAVHRLFQALPQDRRDRSGRPLKHLSYRFEVSFAEPPQYVGGAVPDRMVRPDAHADTHEAVRLERPDEGLQAVVTAGASSPPNADGAQRKIHVIDQDNQVLALDLVLLEQPSYRQTAQVHE